MNNRISRRLYLGAAVAAAAAAAPRRRLSIGYTCITWGAFPRGAEAAATLEDAVRDVASLGFSSFETFPEVLEDWDRRGALRALIDKYELPLKSGYIRMNLTDPGARKDNLAQVTRLARIIKKYGGTFGVLAPGSIERDGYDFAAHKANIVAVLNECAKAVNDAGLGAGLHQHTGTAIETRDEVYTAMHEADTRHLKFAPDVGQLQKGGADAAKVVKDFLSITGHMHLKDWSGWDHYAGYCPLGQGKVDIRGILEMMERANPRANIMVELDPSKGAPMSALETAQASKVYLRKLGYEFRP